MSKKSKVAAYLGIPLSFLIIGYVFIGIMLQPYIRPFLSIYQLFSIDTIPEFTEISQNLMDEQKEEVPTSGFFDENIVKDIEVGDTYGKITIDTVGIDVPLLYGATPKCLHNGAGQRPQSSMPGFLKPVMIGGHTIPFFKNLYNVEKGDTITITTFYGKFNYQITDMRIILATDSSAYDLTQNKEQLILFTCYPADGIGEKEERLLVYADKISGPEVKKN